MKFITIWRLFDYGCFMLFLCVVFLFLWICAKYSGLLDSRFGDPQKFLDGVIWFLQLWIACWCLLNDVGSLHRAPKTERERNKKHCQCHHQNNAHYVLNVFRFLHSATFDSINEQMPTYSHPTCVDWNYIWVRKNVTETWEQKESVQFQ